MVYQNICNTTVNPIQHSVCLTLRKYQFIFLFLLINTVYSVDATAISNMAFSGQLSGLTDMFFLKQNTPSLHFPPKKMPVIDSLLLFAFADVFKDSESKCFVKVLPDDSEDLSNKLASTSSGCTLQLQGHYDFTHAPPVINHVLTASLPEKGQDVNTLWYTPDTYREEALAVYPADYSNKVMPLQHIQPAATLSIENGTLRLGSQGKLHNIGIVDKRPEPENTMPIITLEEPLDDVHSLFNNLFFDHGHPVVTDIVDDHPYWNNNELADPLSSIARGAAGSLPRRSTASAWKGIRGSMGGRGLSGGGGGGGDGGDDRYWWWRINNRLKKQRSAIMAATAGFITAASAYAYHLGQAKVKGMEKGSVSVSTSGPFPMTVQAREPEEQEPVFLIGDEKIEVYDRLARTERVELFNKNHPASDQEFEEELDKSLDPTVWDYTGNFSKKMIEVFFPDNRGIDPSLLKKELIDIINKIADHLERADVIINFRTGILNDFYGRELNNYYQPESRKHSSTTVFETDRVSQTELALMRCTNELELHDDDEVRARHIRFRDQPSSHNRPFYGSLYFGGNRYGNNPLEYGRSFMVLKKQIKPSCIFIACDTFSGSKHLTPRSVFQMKLLALDGLKYPVSTLLIDKIIHKKDLPVMPLHLIEAQIYCRVLIPEMISELHIAIHDEKGERVYDNGVDHKKLAKVVDKMKREADKGNLPFALYIDGKHYLPSHLSRSKGQ